MPEGIEHTIILTRQNNYYIHTIEYIFELIGPWVSVISPNVQKFR